MIIRYTAEIKGVVVNSETTTFSINNFTAKLHLSNEKGLESVSIEQTLTEDEKDAFTNTIEEQDDGKYKLELSGYQSIHDEAIHTLQTLESLFGLKGVDKVHWEDAKEEFIPQTEEEEKAISTTEIDISRSYPRRPHEWTFDFSSYDWDVVGRLKVPLAFFRRGQLQHRNLDYITAFIEYYFVLEGLYAEGDWKKVEERYVESDELVAIADTTLESLSAEKMAELNAFFDFYGKDKTAEGYLRLITTLRHHLHHYFHEDSSGPHEPNPFDADDYQPVSLALGHTVFLLLLSRVEGIDYTGD